MQIQIRGITSINGNAFPLYVVDGVIVDNETVNDDENAINQAGWRHDVDRRRPWPGRPARRTTASTASPTSIPDDIETIEV